MSIIFADYNFRQNAGLIGNCRSEQKIEIAGKEIARRSGNKAKRGEFRFVLIQDLVIHLAETAPLDSVNTVQFQFACVGGLRGRFLCWLGRLCGLPALKHRHLFLEFFNLPHKIADGLLVCIARRLRTADGREA